MASPMEIDHPPPSQPGSSARQSQSSIASGAYQHGGPVEQQQQQQQPMQREQRPNPRFSQDDDERHHSSLGHSMHYSSSASSQQQQQQSSYGQQQFYHPQSPVEFRHRSSQEEARDADRRHYDHPQLQPPLILGYQKEQVSSEYGHPSSSSHAPATSTSSNRRRQRRPDHPLTLSSSSSSLRLGSSSLPHRSSHRQGPLSPGSTSAAPTPNDHLSPNSDRDAAFSTSGVTSPTTTTTSPSSPQRPYHHHPYYQHAHQPRRFEHDSRQISAHSSAAAPATQAHSRFYPAVGPAASHRQQPHFQHAHAPSVSSPSAAASSPSALRQQPQSTMRSGHHSPTDAHNKEGSSPESPDEIDEVEQESANAREASTSASSSRYRLADVQVNGSVGPIRGTSGAGAGASAAVAAAAKRKSKILNSDRKRICEYHRDNPGHRQDDIAALFGIERSTVSRILKDQDRWLAIEDASDAAKIAKHRTGRFPTLEARLSEWADTLIERDEAVSDGDLKAQALKFAAELGLEGSFRASLGWCEKFREKKGLRKAFGGPSFPLPLGSSVTTGMAAVGGAVPSASSTISGPTAADASVDQSGGKPSERPKQRPHIETGVPVASVEKSGSPPSTESSSNSSHFPSMFSGSLSFSGLDSAGEGNASGSGISRTESGSGATGLTTTASSSSSSIAVAAAAQHRSSRKKPSGLSPPRMQSASPVVPSSAGSASVFGGVGASGARAAHGPSWYRGEANGPRSIGSGGSVSTPQSNSNSTGPSPMTGSIPSPPLPPSRAPYGAGLPPPPIVPSHGGATVGLGLGIGAGSGNATQGGGPAFGPAGSFPPSRQHGVPGQTLPAPASSSFPHAPISSSPARHQSNRTQQSQSHHSAYANHYGRYGLPPPATANLPYSHSSSHHLGSHPHQLPPLSSSSASHLRGSGGYPAQQHDQLQHSLGGLPRHLPRPHTSHHPHSHPHRSHSFQNEPRQSTSGSGTPGGRPHPFAYSSYHDAGASSYYNSSRQRPQDQSPSPPPMLPLPHRYRHNSDVAGLGSISATEAGPARSGLARRREDEVEDEDVVNDEDEVEMYRSSSARRQYALDDRMSHLPNGTEQEGDAEMVGDREDGGGIHGRREFRREGDLDEDQRMVNGTENGYPDDEAPGLRVHSSARILGSRDYEAPYARSDQEMTTMTHSDSSPALHQTFSSTSRMANGSSRHGDADMRGVSNGHRRENGGHSGAVRSPQGQHRRSEHPHDGESPDSLDTGEGRPPNGVLTSSTPGTRNEDAAMFSPLPQSLAEPSTPPPPTAATSAALSAINGLPGHHPNGVNGHAHEVGANAVNGVSAGGGDELVSGSGSDGLGAHPAFGQVMLANEGGDVSIQQARDALDLVLRFLQDQSEAFCPRTHFVTIGNLQGTLAAAAYARAQIRLQQEREAEERQLRPGTASTSTSTSVSTSVPAAAASVTDVASISNEPGTQIVTAVADPVDVTDDMVEMSEAQQGDGSASPAKGNAGEDIEGETSPSGEAENVDEVDNKDAR
ncbi:hypothetical protein OC845_002344 [Tilletia horrida]|nr:hypothetical protein OC845_002344 [Tilletia horrida]